MQLDFTQEQDELRDGVRAMLAKECDMKFVRAVFDGRARADQLWQHMVELGWPALTVDESAGGLGLGSVELAVVVEELGRVMAPGPFVATVTQFAPAIAELGTTEQHTRWLGAVARGEISGALALEGPTTATHDPAGGVRLQGRKEYVLDGATADEIVVIAQAPDAPVAVVVARPAVRVEPRNVLDPSRPLATVVLDDVEVAEERVLGPSERPATDAVERALQVATMASAMETVGTCQTIFDIVLDYAKQREQFGVPIGSFQAIKHKFADMAVLLERARATSYFAALTIAEDDPRREIATSVAKVAADDCQQRVAKEGIQILGGIGFTWEHDMHLLVRRVKSSAALFGTANEHRQRIAGLLGV